MTMELMAMDEFEGLLGDVLRGMANPEVPERVWGMVQEKVWLSERGVVSGQDSARVVFAPAAFEARMRGGRDARSTAAAVLLHAAAIALVFWGVAAHVQFSAPAKVELITALTPPPAPARADAMGGGGGQKGPTPVTKGELPKFADQQIVVPKAPPMIEPKIRMPEATIEVQKDLKMADSPMPNLGLPNSPLVGASMGNGNGTGIGAGRGSGVGPGSGGNTGGGVRRIGGGVSAPVLVMQVDPEFSEEARRAKFMGVVTVNLWVDEHGNPTHVRVARGVGMGLDEKAVEAVRQYRFKPAMEGGRPVVVEMNVEVNFQIF